MTQHNFAKGKVIAKSKNDKLDKKVPGPPPPLPFFKKTCPCTYFYPLKKRGDRNYVLRKTLRHRRFPVNIKKFSRTIFLAGHLRETISECEECAKLPTIIFVSNVLFVLALYVPSCPGASRGRNVIYVSYVLNVPPCALHYMPCMSYVS